MELSPMDTTDVALKKPERDWRVLDEQMNAVLFAMTSKSLLVIVKILNRNIVIRKHARREIRKGLWLGCYAKWEGVHIELTWDMTISSCQEADF